MITEAFRQRPCFWQLGTYQKLASSAQTTGRKECRQRRSALSGGGTDLCLQGLSSRKTEDEFALVWQRRNRKSRSLLQAGKAETFDEMGFCRGVIELCRRYPMADGELRVAGHEEGRFLPGFVDQTKLCEARCQIAP